MWIYAVTIPIFSSALIMIVMVTKIIMVMVMMMIIVIMIIIIIIIIIIIMMMMMMTLKGTVLDLLQSTLWTVNCVQSACSHGRRMNHI